MKQNENIYRVVIMGVQGAGKGTQAENLKNFLQIPHISTGEIFRAHIYKKTNIGNVADKYIKDGLLVPDEIVNNVLRRRLSKDDVKKGFLLDGYPRNYSQTLYLEQLFEVTHVINIHISDKEVTERLSGRRTCQCGTIYHIKYNKPKIEGICDKCGKKLYIREDDKKEIIKKRLEIYHKNMDPILRFYKERGLLYMIDGKKSIGKVWEEIKKIFD